jgi:hypothetical protein
MQVMQVSEFISAVEKVVYSKLLSKEQKLRSLHTYLWQTEESFLTLRIYAYALKVLEEIEKTDKT